MLHRHGAGAIGQVKLHREAAAAFEAGGLGAVFVVGRVAAQQRVGEGPGAGRQGHGAGGVVWLGASIKGFLSGSRRGLGLGRVPRQARQQQVRVRTT